MSGYWSTPNFRLYIAYHVAIAAAKRTSPICFHPRVSSRTRHAALPTSCAARACTPRQLPVRKSWQTYARTGEGKKPAVSPSMLPNDETTFI